MALIGLLGALMGLHVYDKRQAVDKAEQAIHQSYKLSNEKAEDKAKIELGGLILEQQIERENKDEKIRNLGSKLVAANKLLDSRHNRPESWEPTIIREACTGRELFREDGEFLTGEATRADKMVIQRDYYYEQYEKARLMIERINNGN